MTLKDELIAAIQNESNYFNMCFWCDPSKTQVMDVANACNTPSCMAGWICALRPNAAQEIWAEDPETLTVGRVAARIWEQELGEPCKLDFYALHCIGADGNEKEIEEISRKETIDHINGQCEHWPQLTYSY